MKVATVVIIGVAVIFVVFLVLVALAIVGASVWSEIYSGRGRDD